MADPYIPAGVNINGGGATDQAWLQFFIDQAGELIALNAVVSAVPGVHVFTVATQPALGAGDAGYLGWLSDYQHQLRWTGATWQFFGDSNNGFFADFAIVPQSGLWQLCDGTATKYLTLGATLTETSFTTPNLSGTPSYRKSAAAYTGTLNAASGNSGDTSPTVSGNTDDESAHIHNVTGNTTPPSGEVTVSTSTLDVSVGAHLHVHTLSVNSGVGSAHHHGTSGITVNAHHHDSGTIDMANLGVLAYFRR